MKLLESLVLSPSVRLLRFACGDGQPLGHVAGQWVNLHLRVGETSLTRAYSVASAPDPERPSEFELGITRVDGVRGSNFLHDLTPGAEREMDGPHGFFTREGLLEEPALFIGTGTGLCPLRAMIQQALRKPQGAPLGLLFGGRREHDILWGQELQQLAGGSGGRLRYEVTLSRGSSSWGGRRGYVQEHLAAMLPADADRPHVFVCGLSPMIRAVRAALKADYGFDRKHIHSERYD